MSDNNLYAVLEPLFATHADTVAFEESNGLETTYDRLHETVGQFANALTALGVKPGDRVTAQVEKSLQNIYLYLATLRVGAVFNPLNTAYTAHELNDFVGDAKPTVLVVDPSQEVALRAIAECHGVDHVETMAPDGSGSLSDKAAAQSTGFTTVPRAASDLACLLYTSGTTGRSKGAMITHENLISNARALHSHWRFESGDVVLHALPTYHVHGLFVCLHTALLNGSKILWLPRFDQDAVLERLPRATVMMGVPTFYTRLLGDSRFNKESTSNIRLFVAGSAPLLAETHTEFEARTGHRILERYGMTEAGMITSNPYDPEGRIAGSVGYALPDVSVRVADDQGKELPVGEIGTLEARGPNIFSGYWQMPEKTAEEFRDDGYFITGDMAKADPDGRIAIVGRAKDLIISGGFNVYPKEIEGYIDEIDGVGESAVIGVPHPDFGEGVVAVVTASNGPLDPEAVMAPLRGQIAKFKLPKTVFVVNELPRNTMGKVQKAALREQYADVFRVK